MGALCAGVEDERRARFHEFGYSLGLAFQVLDDWLGIWGDASVIGKSTESDLVSGKKTFPVLYGLSRSPEFAQLWEAGGLKVEDVAQAVSLLESCGAGAVTLERAEELTQKALRALDQAVAEPQKADELKELTASLLKRKK